MDYDPTSAAAKMALRLAIRFGVLALVAAVVVYAEDWIPFVAILATGLMLVGAWWLVRHSSSGPWRSR
jgi:hypothetical protein